MAAGPARRPERRVSAPEQARRRAETRRLLAFRDGLPPIAPDTTGQYLHELRAEDDAERIGSPAAR